MQGQDTLDDLLSGSADETPIQTPVNAPEQVEPPVEPTGDKEQDAAPPAESKEVPEPGFVPAKAVQDERRKRQDLEKRLKELEGRLQSQGQPRPHEEQQRPDWRASPDQAAMAMREEIEAQLFQRTLAISERSMRKEHEDFEEVATVFAERAKDNPHLLQQLYSHSDPAFFAYQIGQQIKLMEEIGSDPNAYRAKLEAEILKKHGIVQGQAAPVQKSASQAPAAPSAVPRSLARDVSQQPRNQKGQFDGPTPLEDILG